MTPQGRSDLTRSGCPQWGQPVGHHPLERWKGLKRHSPAPGAGGEARESFQARWEETSSIKVALARRREDSSAAAWLFWPLRPGGGGGRWSDEAARGSALSREPKREVGQWCPTQLCRPLMPLSPSRSGRLNHADGALPPQVSFFLQMQVSSLTANRLAPGANGLCAFRARRLPLSRFFLPCSPPRRAELCVASPPNRANKRTLRDGFSSKAAARK